MIGLKENQRMIKEIVVNIMTFAMLGSVYILTYKKVKTYPIQTQIKFLFIISFLLEFIEGLLNSFGITL